MTDTNYKDQLLRHFQQIYPSGVYPDWRLISVEGPSHNKIFTVAQYLILMEKIRHWRRPVQKRCRTICIKNA